MRFSLFSPQDGSHEDSRLKLETAAQQKATILFSRFFLAVAYNVPPLPFLSLLSCAKKTNTLDSTFFSRKATEAYLWLLYLSIQDMK